MGVWCHRHWLLNDGCWASQASSLHEKAFDSVWYLLAVCNVWTHFVYTAVANWEIVQTCHDSVQDLFHRRIFNGAFFINHSTLHYIVKRNSNCLRACSFIEPRFTTIEICTCATASIDHGLFRLATAFYMWCLFSHSHTSAPAGCVHLGDAFQHLLFRHAVLH